MHTKTFPTARRRQWMGLALAAGLLLGGCEESGSGTTDTGAQDAEGIGGGDAAVIDSMGSDSMGSDTAGLDTAEPDAAGPDAAADTAEPDAGDDTGADDAVDTADDAGAEDAQGDGSGDAGDADEDVAEDIAEDIQITECNHGNVPTDPGCQVEKRIRLNGSNNLGIAADGKVKLEAWLRNLTPEPQTVTIVDACPNGKAIFSGFPEPFDYYNTCTAGACAPDLPPIVVELKPCELYLLESQWITFEGTDCYDKPEGDLWNMSVDVALADGPNPVMCGPIEPGELFIDGTQGGPGTP